MNAAELYAFLCGADGAQPASAGGTAGTVAGDTAGDGTAGAGATMYRQIVLRLESDRGGEEVTRLVSKKGKVTVLRRPLTKTPASKQAGSSLAPPHDVPGFAQSASAPATTPPETPVPLSPPRSEPPDPASRTRSPLQTMLHDGSATTLRGQNRVKKYLIPEGTPLLFLERLGVMTATGAVHAAKHDKFRQINRFLEYVDDILPHLLAPLARVVPTRDASGLAAKDASAQAAPALAARDTFKPDLSALAARAGTAAAPQDGTPATPLRVIDFGCGKAYLTFALYYYLAVRRGVPCDILGLDLKKDVIADCARLAADCGYTGLHFSCGDIETYRAEHGIASNATASDADGTANSAADGTVPQDCTPPVSANRSVPATGDVDLVISLHACDTATDYALAFAVEHGAKAILSVPCCQHELNAKLKKHCADPALDPLLRYGIVKERFSALATDVLRAGELEKAGYKTQLLEFIDFDGTPKNLLIRAVRGPATSPTASGSSPSGGATASAPQSNAVPSAAGTTQNPCAALQAALGVELTLPKLLAGGMK